MFYLSILCSCLFFYLSIAAFVMFLIVIVVIVISCYFCCYCYCYCLSGLCVLSQTKAKGPQLCETRKSEKKKSWRHIQLTSSAQDFKGRSCGYLDGDLVSDRHTTRYGPPQHEIQDHPRLGVKQPWHAKRQARTWYDDILHGNVPSTCFSISER